MSEAPIRRKRISCKRCQTRKLKCSRTDPCSNCSSGGHACQFRENDARKRPVAQDYVTALEARVAWLESFLKQLKAESDEGRSKLLESLHFEDHLSHTSCVSQSTGAPIPTSQAYLRRTHDGLISYHGPTSIYHVGSESTSDTEVVAMMGDNYPIVDPLGAIPSRDPSIEQAILLFFRWQYPHFMFVYREAFLLDHLENRYGGRYWSSSLVYILSALGSLTSADPALRSMSGYFFDMAKEALDDDITRPRVTTIQSLLCIAFYEIGRGNISQGWLFSGMAFRISQDLGIQRDLGEWPQTDSFPTVRIDHEIRRRVYWGCYTSDALISLILGRPVYFHDRDSVVNPSEPLPDNPGLEAWLESGNTGYKVTRLIPYLKNLSNLGGIIHQALSQIFSLKACSYRSKNAFVHEVDVDLGRWLEALPDSLRWNRWWPVNKSLEPHVASLHLTFLCVRICIHRENLVSSHDPVSTQSSREQCEALLQIISQLIRHYKTQHDLRQAPIIFVYAIALSIDVNGLLQKPLNGHTQPDSTSTDIHVRASQKDLEKCAKTWEISREIHLRLFQNFPQAEALGKSVNDTNMVDSPPLYGQQSHESLSDSLQTYTADQAFPLFGLSMYQPDLADPALDDLFF